MTGEPPASDRGITARRWIFPVILGAGMILVAVVVAFSRRSDPKPSQASRVVLRASDREPSGRYAGSRSCAECHPGEYASYTRSGHSRTLHAPAQHPLARRLDGHRVADPEQAGISWIYSLKESRLQVTREGNGPAQTFDIDYALGSGHHATTFLTITDVGNLAALEHRLTLFSDDNTLHITPGQRSENPNVGTTDHGRNLNAIETIKCISCHTTRVSAAGRDRLDFDDIIPNVSCERCHEPSRTHVADARAGRPLQPMPFGLETWTADSQMTLCGQCHRHPSKAPPGRITPNDPALARFQPVGLMMSRCYKESNGALSCVNCHDPHARASSDRASYEATCLGCHQKSPQSTCPKSPRSGCIDCHMPRVDSGQRILFSDHWIRVRE